MDIYSILASKPHNTHHLNRYISFIQQCQQKNVDYEGVTEGHHICPKAEGMFPEYADLKAHSWNRAALTPRQHFIAHIILEKSFNCKETKRALFFMSNGNWKEYTNYSKRYERLRNELKHIWIENGEKLGKSSLGNTVVKDLDGNTYRVPVDDPRLATGELTGVQKGTVTVKDKYGNTMNVSIDDPQYLSEELVGVAQGYVVTKDIDGNKFRVYKDDPRYLSGKVIKINWGSK